MTRSSAEAVSVHSPGGADALSDREDATARRAGKGASHARTATGGGTGSPLGRFARRGRNYGHTILWTLRDTFAAEPRRFAMALLLGGLSLAAQALAVLVVYGYSQTIQRDGSLVVPFVGIDWSARTDVPFLLAVVAGFATSLSAVALLNFLSQGLLLGIVRRSMTRAIERLARAVNALPDPRAPVASRIAARMGFAGLNGGLGASARSAFLIVQTIPPFLGAVAAGGLLLWMEPILTSILIGVAATWTALLYPIALRTVRYARTLRRAVVTLRRDFRIIPTAPAVWMNAHDVADSYTGWLGARVRIIVVVGVGIALIVSIAIYVMGAAMMGGSQEWPALVAYIGALQVALNGAFRMVRVMAIVSRHYVAMVRNRLLVQDLTGLRRPTRPLGRGELITLARGREGEPITAAVGELLAVMGPGSIHQIQLAALGAKDAQGSVVRSAALARDVRQTPLPDAPIVFVDGRLLGSGRGELEKLLADRLVVVVHTNPATVGRFGEGRLLLVEHDTITLAAPLGSEEATKALRRAANRAAKDRHRENDDEFDDVE